MLIGSLTINSEVGLDDEGLSPSVRISDDVIDRVTIRGGESPVDGITTGDTPSAEAKAFWSLAGEHAVRVRFEWLGSEMCVSSAVEHVPRTLLGDGVTLVPSRRTRGSTSLSAHRGSISLSARAHASSSGAALTRGYVLSESIRVKGAQANSQRKGQSQSDFSRIL